MNRSNLIALKTLTKKECQRIIRIWSQTIVPPAITMLLYFLIFGQFLGRHIGTIDGVSYISYIAPGFIMMSSLTNTYSNVSGSFFINKFQRSIEDLIVAPVPNWVILLGFMLGGIFRGILIVIVITVIASFFTDLTFTHYFMLLFAVLFSLIPLSAAGLINGLVAKKFDDISIIPTFILTPLTYLGGVFYPISHLTPFWHTMSLFNPIIYMINLFRYSMLGISDVNPYWALFILIGLSLVLYSIAYGMLKRGVGLKK